MLVAADPLSKARRLEARANSLRGPNRTTDRNRLLNAAARIRREIRKSGR